MRTEESKKIIELMNKLKEDYTPENQFALLDALFKTTVFIPTTEVPVGGVAKPIPAAATTTDGRMFQPAFLDEDDVDEKARETYITTIEFEKLANIVIKQNEMYKKTDSSFKLVEGIVINPSLQATVISTRVLALYLSASSTQNMSAEEYTVFARCRFEQWLMPTAFYKKGEDFVKALLQGKEKFLNEMFAQTYDVNVSYPYTEEDFKVYAMNPDEETSFVVIELPEKNYKLGTAERIFLMMKKDSDVKRFFAIVKEPGTEKTGDIRVLVEINADRKAERLGMAPVVGAEISWLLKNI